MITLSDLVEGTEGTLFCGEGESFDEVSTDSRGSSLEGKVFIPLKGDNFDAHKFVLGALEKGASAIVFEQFDEAWRNFENQCAFVKVPDTLEALQDLSSFWREKFSIPVLAITGSNGKTTTKDFTAQILSREGLTCSSQGSFNNHWGVPLTLLNIRNEHQFAVVEMGMNHPGEISLLNEIAEPTAVVVTNVGRAHTGFFKDLSEISQAKAEIYETAPADAHMIFNLDNEWTAKMFKQYSERAYCTYSRKKREATVFLQIKEKTAKGFKLQGHIDQLEGETEVFFWGEQNLENLLAAISLCLSAGMEAKKIWPAIPQCETGWGRNQWIELESKAQVLFDGYNANPESFSQLINNLVGTLPSYESKIAVLGEMLELGDQTAFEHEELGRKMATLDWDKVFFIGPSGRHFQRGWESSENMKTLMILDTYEESLVKEIQSMLNPHTLLVLKGSRGQKLERVVEKLSPQNFSK